MNARYPVVVLVMVLAFGYILEFYKVLYDVLECIYVNLASKRLDLAARRPRNKGI